MEVITDRSAVQLTDKKGSFLKEDFLLENEAARNLYFNYAAGLPVIDDHNHIPTNEIAENRKFVNYTTTIFSGTRTSPECDGNRY